MEKGQLRQVILKDKNLKNVHTVSNMLRTLQTHIVKRLAKAFKEWNNYIILKKIIDKEKSLQITRKLESFIFSVCQDVRDLLDSDRCSLWLMDVESQKLWAQHGDGVGTAMHVSLSGNSHVADCARKKSAVLVKDPYKTALFNSSVDKQLGYRTTSILCVPLFDVNPDELNPGYRSPKSKSSGGKINNVVRGVIQFVNKYSGAYTIEDRDNAEEFANFLKMRILTADERTDFRMLREDFRQWCGNKRRLRYEARIFGRTIQEFRDNAQILLRCDDIVVLMPNKREKKGKSVLVKMEDFSTGINFNSKLSNFVSNILFEKRPEIINDSATISDLNLKKLFNESVSSILAVPFANKIQHGTESGCVAFAVKFEEGKFESGDRELLSKLGNHYGGLSDYDRINANALKARRRKIFKWMSVQLNRKKRDKRQSVVALRSAMASPKATISNKSTKSASLSSNVQKSENIFGDTNFDTYMGIFRRTLAKDVDLAMKDEAEKASKNLPDIRLMMLDFFSLFSGNKGIKRASITEHTMIASVNDMSREIAVALLAANNVKEKLEKSNRMLKHEIAKNSNLQIELTRMKKPIKKYEESTDTYDLGYRRKSLRILSSVLTRILKKRRLCIWRRWLHNTDMLFKMSNFIHKRGLKVKRVLEMLERHDFRKRFYAWKSQSAGQRRKRALSIYAWGIKTRQILHFFFFRWNTKVSLRISCRKAIRRLAFRRKFGLQFHAWGKWKDFNKIATAAFIIVARLKKAILSTAFCQLHRGCKLVDKRQTVMKLISLKLCKSRLNIGMARWKNFLGQDRKKSHGQKMAAYMSRNNMRKQFLRWKTSIYFVTHTASHTDIARGVAAMNIARLHAWWKKFKQLGAWKVWCDHRRKENTIAQAKKKIRKKKKQKYYGVWADKYYRRQRVRRMLAGSARLVCSRMIKKWHIVTIILQRRKQIVCTLFQRREKKLARDAWRLWHENFSLFKQIDNKYLLARNANLRRLFNIWHRNTADRKYENLKCSYTTKRLLQNRASRIFRKWAYFARYEGKKNMQVKKLFKILGNAHVRLALRKISSRAKSLRKFRQLRVRIVAKTIRKCFHAMHDYTVHQKQCDATIYRLCSRLAKNNLTSAWGTWVSESRRVNHYRKFVFSQTFARNRRSKEYIIKTWRRHINILIVCRKMEIKSSIRRNNKVFDCWHWFATRKRRRRLVAGRILRSMYKHVIHSSIKRWLDHAHHRTKILNLTTKNMAKQRKLCMTLWYNTWADHAHKLSHERTVLKNIFFRITHRHQANMFYLWHEHAHHRHMQRVQMKIVFSYMSKGYERKAWDIWTGRAQHFKKVYKLLDKMGQRWKYRNEYTSFHQWHIKVIRANQVRRIVKFASTFMKRYLKRFALQKWEKFYRITNAIRHKEWMDNVILENQNHVISMQNRFQDRKITLRCFILWYEMVNRRCKLRYIVRRCAFRSIWRTLYDAYSKWIFQLKRSDEIKRNLKLATRRKAIRTSIVAFRQWRSISWQMTTKLQKQKFADTRKDIEKKIMKMPVAWSIMKWQMFASSMSYKELCRAEVRSIRTENRQLQNALLDYHRRGLFLLSDESKSRDLQKIAAPRNQYILQKRGNYSLSYRSGDEMLKATYKEE